MDTREALSARSLVAIALLGMALLGAGIYFGVSYAVDRAVVADAKDKAIHWADYFLTVMPDLDELIAKGEPTGEQQHVIEAAQKVGGVFRFKLYDVTGRQMLVSDDAATADEGDDDESRDHNAEAAEALAGGEPIINISDEHEAGMPPLFVEGYVPIKSAAGTERGVVEVYIDQTGTADLFRIRVRALVAPRSRH